MPLKKSTPPSAEKVSRRNFIKTTGLAAAAVTIVPRYVLGGKGFIAPSDKIMVAGIGAGGKGESDIANFAKSGKAEIAFLCDVDDRRASKTVQNFPKAKYYKDYRKMLDENHKSMDAVSISTPDHMHAVQAMAAMQLGKHVYVQKPLTHDIYEARMLTEVAKKNKVVTQMGNQGASGDGVRQMREMRIAPMLPVLRVIAFVAAIAIVVVMSVRAFQDVDFGRLTLWPLPVAFAFAVGWWVLLARGWALLVTGSARRSDISMWCRTQAIRYLPGGIWAPASRATLLPGTLSDKLSTVGAENVLALCAALAVGGAGLAAGGDFVWLPLVLAPGAALAGAWLVAGWSRVSAPRALRVTGNDVAGFVAYAIAAALVQWAVSGRLDLLTVAGAAAVAWGVGLVVIIAPSGLGVREVTYVALLSGTFSNSEATTAAVTLRLVTIFAELLVLVLLGRPTEDADTPSAAG